MFVFHACMMGLMLIGEELTVLQEVQIVLALAIVMVTISIRHRRVTRWRRAEIGAREVWHAAGTAVLIGLFLYAATPTFSPWNSRILPWYLAGLNIGLYRILNSLKITYPSKAGFLSHCRKLDAYGIEVAPVPVQATGTVKEAPWKRRVRAVYQMASLAIFLTFLLFFYSFGTAYKSGSPVPTATQTEPITDHGRTVYVAPELKRRSDALEQASSIGIPSIIALGAFLHFVVRVQVFDTKDRM